MAERTSPALAAESWLRSWLWSWLHRWLCGWLHSWLHSWLCTTGCTAGCTACCEADLPEARARGAENPQHGVEGRDAEECELDLPSQGPEEQSSIEALETLLQYLYVEIRI